VATGTMFSRPLLLLFRHFLRGVLMPTATASRALSPNTSPQHEGEEQSDDNPDSVCL